MKGQGVDGMKRRWIVLLAAIIASVQLAGSVQSQPQQSEWVVLPDLSNMNETEIVNYLADLPLKYEIDYVDTQNKLYDNQFIMYDSHSIGDIVSNDETIQIVLYPPYVSETTVTLPNLSGLTKTKAIEFLNDNGYLYVVRYHATNLLEEDGLLSSYQEGLFAGDLFDNSSAFEVYFYQYIPSELVYYQIEDLPYDGPYLDESFFQLDALNPRGGAFGVSLDYCTDGDTARFIYPVEIYNAINSTAKSTRFLNIDSEETYSGGVEEWGKPASVYTCQLLQSASSIALQTDPGDGLLDTHGRLLAWVWVQFDPNDPYQLLNYMVVRQGLAQVKYEFGAGLDLAYDGLSYNNWMHVAEDQAIAEERAQWGPYLDYYWNYETNSPYWERWNGE